MLDKTCPSCGNPIFRLKDGELYCPSCEKRVVVVKSEAERAALLEKEKHSRNKEAPIRASGDLLDENNFYSELRTILLEKAREISKLISGKVPFSTLAGYVDVLQKIFHVLRQMKDEPTL